MKPENNLEDSLERLVKLGTDPDKFKIWLKSFLINNISDPLPGFSLTEYPHEYLSRIYESTGSVRFQERLRSTVKQFFKDWNINAVNTESIEYYSSLLNLIADLPVTEMYSELIETALSGFYCGIFSENEPRDVQTLILEVIAGMQVPGATSSKDQLMDLVKKYILDPMYTPLCFRIAWQTEYKNAINYISLLLEYSKERKFDIYETIERFLLGGDVVKFKELLVPILERLQINNMMEYFLKILLKLGIEIRTSNYPFGTSCLLLIWEPYDLLAVSRARISCDNDEIVAQIERFRLFDVDNQEEKDKKARIFIKKLVGLDAKPFSFESNSGVMRALT
jgi:hypothetical protein